MMKVVGENKEVEKENKPVNINDLGIDELRHIVMEQDKFIKNLQMEGVFKRLDYLLEILHLGDKFPEKFIKYCTSEIENLIVIDKEAYGVQ